MVSFHKRNPGVYRGKDWNKPQPSHCAIHGACTHAESDCTVIPKLCNEPNLMLKTRQPRNSQERPTKGDRRDRKRPRQEKTESTQLLLQRLDKMEKRLKKLAPPKEKSKPKVKKQKPVLSDSEESDSGSNP
jgi:hypothetical protein